MSFPNKSPDNNQKAILQKIRQCKSKICGCPINVKMCKIPNNIGFDTKTKTNLISSSYFNLSLKNKKNYILKKLKNKNNKKTSISRLGNDINTNYFTQSITNNKTNINNNIISNNSLLTNSINKSKTKIINKKNNITKEDFQTSDKKNNYSFIIKVNKTKKALIPDNTRNNSIKKNLNTNDNINNNRNIIHKINSVSRNFDKIDNILNNRISFKSKSKNNKNKKDKIKEKNEPKKKYNKSLFKKIKKRGNLSLSCSRNENDKTKDKMNHNSYLSFNISYINPTNRNDKKNLKMYNIIKLHNRNNTTFYNKAIIKSLLNKSINLRNKKKSDFIINEPSNKKGKFNKTDILNYINIDNIKSKKNLIISPKNKYGTNIIKNNINEKKEFNFKKKNNHSISENINNLKNIISKINDTNFSNYNNNESSIYCIKKKKLKDIPIPKFNKNKKLEKPKSIKDIKITKLNNNNNNNTNTNNNLKQNKNNGNKKDDSKRVTKRNGGKNFVPFINNYDRDDHELDINVEDLHKDKISLINILKQKNKHKSLIGKKINIISLIFNSKNQNKNRHISPDLNYRLRDKKNGNSSERNNKNNFKKKLNNNSDINLYYKKNNKYLKIDNGTGYGIKKNIIENNLFSEKNLIDINNIEDDKFDDLYSIIKRLPFNSILLNNEGTFSLENKQYQKYSKIFNILYDKYYVKNLSTVKKINKSSKRNKNYSASTKMDTTSYKKNNYIQENNDKVKEFKLLI